MVDVTGATYVNSSATTDAAFGQLYVPYRQQKAASMTADNTQTWVLGWRRQTK